MTGLPPPFRWDGDLLAATLDGAEARFTGRVVGDLARYEPDRAEQVRANMERLAARLRIPVDAWAQSRQVHGTEVHVTRHRDHHPGDPERPGDAQVVTGTAFAGVVLTADCLPVVVAKAGGVAVVHAGWRGLADGVLEAGVAALRAIGDDTVLEAAIGPGAGGCCYEVGPEVRAAFAGDGVLQRDGNAPIDLKAIAARRLHAAGVRVVHDCGLCTMCAIDPATGERRFFSHRADGGVTGRQAGITWLN